MSKERNLEIEEALDAVRNIRKAVKGNTQIVRPLFLDKHYIPLCWVASATMFLYTLFLIIMKNLFTTTQPAWMNSVTVIFFITTVTVFTVWKTILIARYAKEDNNTSLENFMKLPEIYNLMVDCGITMLTLIVLLIFLGFKLGTMWVFLPGSFFYIGISLFICGDMYSIVEYRVLAILTFAFAIITAIFMKSNFLIWLSASYAIYFALLAITLLFTGRDLHLKKD